MAKLPKKTLAGVVGAIAAGVLTVIVPKFEGVKLAG
ncbi:lysozyme, partial [Burkholderia pseudomallei]|nr:lysozyme [Burkholderia pseudomallei]MBF3943256.1 lysozyme [Burkholderia pseudomallei]